MAAALLKRGFQYSPILKRQDADTESSRRTSASGRCDAKQRNFV